MKIITMKLFVIFTIVMSFLVMQDANAETVEGTIDSIEFRPYKIVVDGTEISGVRYNYLCNQYNICLEEGDTVSVEYYEYECSDGTILLKACKISMDDVTIDLRDCQ